MKKIIITTPENIEVEYNLANIGSRTAAFVVDTLLQTAIMILLAIPITIVCIIYKDLWINYYGWVIGAAIILITLITYGYYIFCEIKMNGRTFGKKLLKIRAIRNNGEPINIKHSAIRNLFKVIIDSIGIGIVLIFFTKENKRIGDFAASTIVISENTKTKPSSLDNLSKIKENFEHYLTKDECELLREYYRRKDSLEDSLILRNCIKSYFYNKFNNLGVINEWQEFINELFK